MHSNRTYVLVTFLAITLAVCVQPKKDEDIKIHNMIYLGTVDGKSFYAEKVLQKNWSDANIYCKEANMQLGSIVSDNQANLLSSWGSHPNVTASWYWTSGRESEGVSRFVWDTRNETVQNPGFFAFNSRVSVSECLKYAPYSNTLVTEPCSATAGILCEVAHT